MAESIDNLQKYDLIIKETDRKGKGLFAQTLIKEGKLIVYHEFVWKRKERIIFILF